MLIFNINKYLQHLFNVIYQHLRTTIPGRSPMSVLPRLHRGLPVTARLFLLTGDRLQKRHRRHTGQQEPPDIVGYLIQTHYFFTTCSICAAALPSSCPWIGAARLRVYGIRTWIHMDFTAWRMEATPRVLMPPWRAEKAAEACSSRRNMMGSCINKLRRTLKASARAAGKARTDTSCAMSKCS